MRRRTHVQRIGAFGIAAILIALAGEPGLASGGDSTAKVQDAATALVKGNHQTALTLYGEALADALLSNDRRATILNDRGVVYSRLNQPRQALDDFNRAIQLFPENPVAYNNRGNTLLAVGLIREAIKDYDRAIALSPGYAAGYNNRASAFVRLGVTEEAIRDYTKAIELMPANAAPLGGRGKALLLGQRPYAALRDLSRSLKLDPRYAPGYRSRAEVHLVNERYEEAIEDLSRALAYDATSVDLLLMRGRAYLAAGTVESGIKDFSRAIEIEPKRPESYEMRGVAHGRADAIEEAESDLAKAIELNPRSATAFAYRAWVYKHSGQLEVASRDLERAVRLEPQRAEVLWARGEVMEALGRTDEAVGALRSALVARPVFPEAQAALTRITGSEGGDGDQDLGGTPVDGWRIVRRRGRTFAVSPGLAGLRVPIEMAGDGTPRLIEWDVKKPPFNGFATLRFSTGAIAGPNGPEETETIALIDTIDRVILGLIPHRRGARIAPWTWADGKVTIAAVDAVTDEFQLKAPPSQAAAVPRPAPVAQASSVERRPGQPKWTTPEWAPWNDGTERRQRSSQSSSNRKPKTLFDLIFGN